MSVKIFQEYFIGRKDVYGMNQVCIKEPLTNEIYQQHLDGIKRIGVYPIFNEKFTRWIALDIDKPDFNIPRDIVLKARGHKLNAYIERSKSKGFHVWIFFDEDILAMEARLVVEMILAELDIKCEIFPKQDIVTKEGFGNFIFLPLFGGDTKSGKTVFVNIENEIAIRKVESLNKLKRTTTKIFKEIIEINNLKREIPERTVSEEKPISKKELPCIEKIKHGVPKGHRNEAAFRLTIHLKEKGLSSEDIGTLTTNWNLKNEAPLEKKELLNIINSVFKGKYKSYGCDNGIIAEYCDKQNCPLVLAQDKKAQIEKGIIVMVFRDPQTMVFRKKDYEYRLTSFEFSKAGKFKSSFTLSKNKALIYKDSISLDKASNRKRFVLAAKDPEIDKDLIKIEDLARRQIEKEEKEALSKPKQLYIMTEIEKNEAIKFLETTSDILSKVIDITNELGVVGEESLRLMAYLCFTSRITAEPLSVTIKGETSSGKSFIPQKVIKLVPEEGCFFITRATQNAFFHLPEDGMQHKIIYINELPGTESADYSIRTAQSEGNLILWMPVKDPHTGDITTQTKTVKGPVGFLLTTTKASLFAENETRNFSLFTDDSPELTKRIGKITINKAKGYLPEVDTAKLNLFKNFQRLLNPEYKVIMPFAEEIFEGFPDKPVRIRRDKERFRILIEIITLLHQFHRKQYKTDGKTYLESTLADYHLAKVIAEETLLQTIYEIGPASKQIWIAILKLQEKWINGQFLDKPFEFSYKEIMEELDWKYEKAKKWTLTLLRAGTIQYAEGSTGGRGKAVKYQLTKSIPTVNLTAAFLPSIETLYDKYPCSKELFYNPITREKIKI